MAASEQIVAPMPKTFLMKLRLWVRFSTSLSFPDIPSPVIGQEIDCFLMFRVPFHNTKTTAVYQASATARWLVREFFVEM